MPDRHKSDEEEKKANMEDMHMQHICICKTQIYGCFSNKTGREGVTVQKRNKVKPKTHKTSDTATYPLCSNFLVFGSSSCSETEKPSVCCLVKDFKKPQNKY